MDLNYCIFYKTVGF